MLHENQSKILAGSSLQLPEHLYSINNSNISVGEVIESSQGEGRESPNQSHSNIRYDSAAIEKAWSNIVHYNGLNAPVGVKNCHRAEKSICCRSGVEERNDDGWNLSQRHGSLCGPHPHMIS